MVKSFEECKVFLAKKPVLFHVKDDDTMYVDMQADTVKQQLKQATYKQVKCKDGKTIQWYEATVKKYTVAFDIHVMIKDSKEFVDPETNMFLLPGVKEIWEDKFNLFLEKSAYMICFPTEQTYFFDDYQEELEERGLLPQFVFVRRYTLEGKKGRRITKINIIYEEEEKPKPTHKKMTKKEMKEQVLQAISSTVPKHTDNKKLSPIKEEEHIAKKYEKKYNKDQLYKLVSEHEIKLPKSTTKAKMADALAKEFGALYLH